MIPRSAISHSGRFSLTKATRSPGLSPMACNASASAATWRAASDQLIDCQAPLSLGPQERLVAFLRGPRKEHRHQVRKMFELTRQSVSPRPKPNAAGMVRTIRARFPERRGASRSLAMRILSVLLAFAATACAAAPAPLVTTAPVVEASATEAFVIAANPLAAEAGAEVLRRGGSAVDAAVAVQAMLSLVEPQSSGLGGGAFVNYLDAASGRLTIYDGRETAPAGASASMFLGPRRQAARLRGRGGQRARDRRARRGRLAWPGPPRAWQAAVEQPVRIGRARRRRRLHRQPATVAPAARPLSANPGARLPSPISTRGPAALWSRPATG